ncbi:MAG: hypothetical protein GY832_47205 [Chloroflexi bacterium]|nr:hypothetical protein [Chloroflexota bacterium]
MSLQLGETSSRMRRRWCGFRCALSINCYKNRPDLLIASAAPATPVRSLAVSPLVWSGGVLACFLEPGAVECGVGELVVGVVVWLGAAVPFGGAGLGMVLCLLWGEREELRWGRLTSPLAQMLFDSLRGRMYNLAKTVIVCLSDWDWKIIMPPQNGQVVLWHRTGILFVHHKAM